MLATITHHAVENGGTRGLRGATAWGCINEELQWYSGRSDKAESIKLKLSEGQTEEKIEGPLSALHRFDACHDSRPHIAWHATPTGARRPAGLHSQIPVQAPTHRADTVPRRAMAAPEDQTINRKLLGSGQRKGARAAVGSAGQSHNHFSV